MPPVLRNILGVVFGFVVGSIVNMFVLRVGQTLVPLPEGVDNSDMEKLAASMHLFGPQHFVVPFLAHALGTFVGAGLTAFVAATRKLPLALLVGALFLAGGVAAALLLPAPAWFIAADLVLAYLPVAWLAGRMGARGKPGPAVSSGPGTR